MRIEDRIAKNSVEHWALFALERYEEHAGHAPTAADVYEATGEKFPSEQWIADALDELVSRGLVDGRDGGVYATKSGGAVALKRHGDPDDEPWVDPEPPRLPSGSDSESVADGPMSMVPERPWEPSDIDHVWRGSEADATDYTGAGPETGNETAQAIIDVLPTGYDVVITVGPYRPYCAAYAVDTERKIVLLDYYSVEPREARYKEPLVRAVHRAVMAEYDEAPERSA